MKPLYLILTSYIITMVLASSSLFARCRGFIKAHTPTLQVEGHKHFIDCRLCVGFWVALAVCLYSQSVDLFLPVYGASYFLATQERK